MGILIRKIAPSITEKIVPRKETAKSSEHSGQDARGIHWSWAVNIIMGGDLDDFSAPTKVSMQIWSHINLHGVSYKFDSSHIKLEGNSSVSQGTIQLESILDTQSVVSLFRVGVSYNFLPVSYKSSDRALVL